MNEALFNLRKRFTVGCIIICGIFLAILFAVVFATARIASSRSIDRILDNALISTRIDSVPSRPSGIGEPSRCMIISVAGENVATEGFTIYSDEEIIDDIVDGAISVKEGYYRVDSYFFAVKSADRDHDTIYAVYDRSLDHASSLTQAQTLIAVYVFGLLMAALVGWKISELNVEPVEEAFEKQKELVANASHELKTPLTIISTNLDVIEADPDKTIGENKKWFDNINSLVGRMDKLILEMLELSRLESIGQTIIKENVNLTDLINGALLSFDASFFEKKVNIESSVAENVIVNSNSQLLQKLCGILFDNALKYTDEDGTITVNLTSNGKKAVISLRNTGKGISPDNLTRVFERFYKEDEARNLDSSPKSFGLGLSIAKAIVESLDGTISCNSIVDKYTEFVITIPE